MGTQMRQFAADQIREDHGRLMDACGLPSYEQLTEINAELVAALERFANLDNNVASDLWAIDKAYCEQARAALARAKP
jgi:hypothetical protein